MKRMLAGLTAVFLLAGTAFASAPGMSPLKIFSGGFGGGAAYALNEELEKDASDVFGKFSLMGSWFFTDNVSLSGDLNWFICGKDCDIFGADFGIDYFLSSSRVKPFIGAGVGAHYVDRAFPDGAEEEFGAKFGASLTARAGIAFEISETVEIRLRVPYHVILNHTTDMGIGFDVGVMFFNSLRKVRKY